MVEGEINLNNRASNPAARAEALKNALELHRKTKEQEIEREKKLIQTEYAQKLKNDKKAIQKEMAALESGNCVAHLKQRVLDLKEKVSQMQTK